MKEEEEEEEEKERLVDTECVQGAASIHLAPAFESHQHTSVFAGRPGCLSPYLPLPTPPTPSHPRWRLRLYLTPTIL